MKHDSVLQRLRRSLSPGRLATLLTGALLASLAACSPGAASDGSWSTPAVIADEAARAAEKAPDFASPQVADPGLKVEGLPEAVTWYTSKPGVFGSSRAKTGGTFRTWTDEFPETFRTVGPNANGSFRSWLLNGVSLIEVNNDTKEWMPGLATHWAFGADGKTVYYKLNEKARWTDREPVTSADFLFMLDYMRSPHIQDPWYNEFYSTQIKEIKAWGDHVISVTSDAAASPDDLLYNTSVSPRPKHFYPDGITQDWVEKAQWEFEPTTGPYMMTDFKKGESVTFTKVKDWWGHQYDYNKYRYNVDTLVVSVITGGLDIAQKYFLDGQIDTFPLIIPQKWSESEEFQEYIDGYVDRLMAYYIPLEGISGMFLNVQKAPLDSKAVRQGLTYAINMQKMLDTALQGAYSRYHNIGLGHVFAGINFDDDSLRMPDFDPVKAGELFDQAGYATIGDDGIRRNAKGQRLAVEVLYSATHHTERLAVLREEAKKAGVDLELKLMQQGVFTAVLQKKFQIWWGGMSTSMYPDYWEHFHSKNATATQTNNFFGYGNPELDKLLDAFRASGDLKQKAEITRQVQRFVHDEALVIPNYYVPFNRGAAWKWWRFPAWLGQKYSASYDDPLGNGYFWYDAAIHQEVQQAMDEGQSYKGRTFVSDQYKAQ